MSKDDRDASKASNDSKDSEDSKDSDPHDATMSSVATSTTLERERARIDNGSITPTTQNGPSDPIPNLSRYCMIARDRMDAMQLPCPYG